MEQRDFARAALEYVCLIQEVQERKKFEFVETVSWMNEFLPKKASIIVVCVNWFDLLNHSFENFIV